jgi:ribosomal-protein-alanine N-acetyltransferase
LSVDAAFEPILSSRVDIPFYAHKLHDRAVRFEAWLDNDLVGLVASYCNQVSRGKAFVTSVSIKSDFQGQGVACELMKWCIDHARSLGFTHMELHVDQRSLPALALYQKLGFSTLCSNKTMLTLSITLGPEVT